MEYAINDATATRHLEAFRCREGSEIVSRQDCIVHCHENRRREQLQRWWLSASVDSDRQVTWQFPPQDPERDEE
jgi:hypothetical protein